MQQSEMALFPHRRKNMLTGEWILVSPHRSKRPWQGELAAPATEQRRRYESDCYLCPGNTRANGEINPQYGHTYVFTNDFSSLLSETPARRVNVGKLLQAKSETGICRVVNFSPRHDLTLAELSVPEIERVVAVWQDEFAALGARPEINHVQIFENKGAMMGNSNPHPHCQIWAQASIPMEPAKELRQFTSYYAKTKRSLLADYLKLELRLKERVVYENASFAVVAPYWAVWPFETLVIPKRKIATIVQFTGQEKNEYADALKMITVKYDNLFQTSFPYSAGLHQAPTDGTRHTEWHFHTHFYPPLLRSASIKKFMVGYEMLAEPQRDITPEASAALLRDMPMVHYKSARGIQ
jgi:UDPglucose--hexose-1-phosphate uridylyltransferase